MALSLAINLADLEEDFNEDGDGYDDDGVN
jgi:hypothetical protein